MSQIGNCHPHKLYQNSSFLINYSSLPSSDSFVFPFSTFNWQGWMSWIGKNWHYSIIASAIYIIGIFSLKAVMSKRKAFDLKKPLFYWNAGLGVFSIAGFVGLFPDWYASLSGGGVHGSLCNLSQLYSVVGFWRVAFALSKYVELGDTVFIILRKKPLVFLQWYHHAVTLIMVWILTPMLEPVSRYYCFMNYGVHSLMYPYFALKALDVYIPRWISSLISSIQFFQMVVGISANIYTTYIAKTSGECCRYELSILISQIVYGSFVILFGKLFMDVVKKSKTDKEKSA